MNVAAAVRILESNPQSLITGLNAELKANLGTSHYHRLTEEELSQRHSLIFQALIEWLRSRDSAALQRNGEALGRRRYGQGVPLGQVVLVLILIEKHLSAFLVTAGKPIDEDLRSSMTEFFQKFAYFTAKGYEASLAATSKLTKEDRTEEPVAVMPGPQPAQKDQVMEISRGGQVGEFGG